jgi:hypothetical protein
LTGRDFLGAHTHVPRRSRETEVAEIPVGMEPQKINSLLTRRHNSFGRIGIA